MSKNTFDFIIPKNKEDISLKRYEGKYLIIVNTASKCGLAPQLDELERLHVTYDDMEVLGVSSNQFKQEVENQEEFCKINYGVTFLISDTVDVNGSKEIELFKYLKNNSNSKLGKRIKWNFTKFLILPDGTIYKRYSPNTEVKVVEEDYLKLRNK